MEDAGRGDGDLRCFLRHRRQELEIVDEDRLGPAQLARHAHAVGLARRAALLVMEGGGEARLIGLDILEAQQEIGLPADAIIFAVGDRLQPDPFLQRHHLAHRILAHRAERIGIDRARGELLACGHQRLGADQAADMIGAKRRGLGLWQGAILLIGRKPGSWASETISRHRPLGLHRDYA